MGKGTSKVPPKATPSARPNALQHIHRRSTKRASPMRVYVGGGSDGGQAKGGGYQVQCGICFRGRGALPMPRHGGGGRSCGWVGGGVRFAMAWEPPAPNPRKCELVPALLRQFRSPSPKKTHKYITHPPKPLLRRPSPAFGWALEPKIPRVCALLAGPVPKASRRIGCRLPVPRRLGGGAVGGGAPPCAALLQGPRGHGHPRLAVCSGSRR